MDQRVTRWSMVICICFGCSFVIIKMQLKGSSITTWYHQFDYVEIGNTKFGLVLELHRSDTDMVIIATLANYRWRKTPHVR